jgi:predicted acyl esterase
MRILYIMILGRNPYIGEEKELDAIFDKAKISKREFEIVLEKNVSIKMSDGIKIDVDIYRPDGGGQFPVLYGSSPFNKEIQSARIWPASTRSRRIRGVPDACLEAAYSDFYVRRGYVNIIGNVRGTGQSGGKYQYLSARDVRDSYEIIEWAARQPWCNGNVGMLGMGYFAAHQPMVAELQPPHLKAMAPIGTFWDNYRQFWWPGGILAYGFLRWLLSLNNLDIHSEKSALLEKLGENDYRETIERALADSDIAAVPELVDALHNAAELGNVNFTDIVTQPCINDYWKERGAEINFDKIKTPMYLGTTSHRPGGFYFWPYLNVPKKLVHFPPSYMDRPFYQFSWELLRWFDYWLKELDTGIMDEPPIRIFVRNSNEWLTAEDFPVPGTRFIPFFLHENRILCELEPWPEAESASYDDAPDNHGCLKYYSPPLVENTEIVGPVTLNLYSSCRGVDMYLFASLWDADPEGKETCLTRGWLKASHRELDKIKSKPWLPVHTHENPQNLIPGQVYQLSINLWPTANLFKAGHKIMLKISSADEPPEDLYQVKQEHLCSHRPNTITVYHNAQYPSSLLLPITRGNIVGTYASGGDISLKTREFMKLD